MIVVSPPCGGGFGVSSPIAHDAQLLPFWSQSGATGSTQPDNPVVWLTLLSHSALPAAAAPAAPAAAKPEPLTLDDLDTELIICESYDNDDVLSSLMPTVRADCHSTLVPVHMYSYDAGTFLDPYRDADLAMCQLLRSAILPAVMAQCWGLEKYMMGDRARNPADFTRQRYEELGRQSMAKNRELEDTVTLGFCAAWARGAAERELRSSADYIVNSMLQRLGRGRPTLQGDMYEMEEGTMYECAPMLGDSPTQFTLQRLHMCIDRVIPFMQREALRAST